MRHAHARGERLRNVIVLVIILAAIGLALAPRLPLDAWFGTASPRRVDLATEGLSLPRPAIAPQTSLSGAPPLSESVQARLDLQRAFFAGDFARLDAALLAARDDYVNGRSHDNPAKAVVDAIDDTQLAGIDRCAEWLQAMPDSYPAHWVCGVVWRSGAWAARGGGFASAVGPIRFALMEERLERSNVLLERALELTPRPLEALTLLADNAFAGGNPQQAEAYLQRAGAILPQHAGIHWVRARYAQPVWGGSVEAVRAALAQARQAGAGESTLLDIEDDHIVRPWKMSTPGAARAYWEGAIRKHPTRNRLKRLLDDFVRLENWHDALPVADRLIETYPDYDHAYNRRAYINGQLGRIEAARADYVAAAAMGNEYALQELIMVHIRGGLGLPGKSFGEVVELCLYGATLGTSVGANCLGASYFEGGRSGMPFRQDLPQAFAWHLLAARAGHFNSQYDLGWLLYTGRVAGIEPDAAKKIGTFWLHRAAEQNHQFAQRKIEELRLGAPDAGQTGMLDAFLDRLFGAIESLRAKLS